MASKKINKKCVMCGINFGPTKTYAVAKRIKCCSRRCSNALKSDLKFRGPAVINLREQGYSWVKIAEELGINRMAAWRAPMLWDAATGQNHVYLYTKIKADRDVKITKKISDKS
ncbi:hypothetical protein CL634_07260 [bacterium]|nr:hypothetical protein [bacterium]